MENKSYNLTEQLIESRKIDENFVRMIDGLSLEEILGIKMEAAAKMVKGKLHGLKLYYTMPVIVREALLRYTVKKFKLKSHAANFLGLTLRKYNTLIGRRGIIELDKG